MKPSRLPLCLCSAVICIPLQAISAQTPDEEVKKQDVETLEIRGARNQANDEMNVETRKLMKVAGLDNDPLAAVFSLPGVIYAGGDDGGEPAIRGSSPNDNAFYIDDIPVNYVFHLFGDSIFNENVIRDFALHPAGFGSQYSNATGGVFDVKLRDPKNQDLAATVNLGMLKTGFMVEGGITEDQAFYFTYRRSLIHLFINEGEEDEEDPGFVIYQAPVSDDYQGKYQWLIGNNHKLTFTVAGASDSGAANIAAHAEEARADPDIIGDYEINDKFDSQSLSWQYFGNDLKIMHLTIGHSNEKERESFGAGQFINVDNDVYNARFLYQFNWIDDHQLIAGIDLDREETNYSYDAIIYFCTDHDRDCESKKGDRIQDTDKLVSNNYAAYFNDIWSLNDNWQLETGIRAEYNDYIKQRFIQPRLSLSWFATPALTLTAKAGEYSRFPDVNTVLKKIGNPALNAPTARHYSLGMNYQFADIWQTSFDVYHKDLKNLARSINDGEPNEDLRYSNDLSGDANGFEWLIRRDKRNGWYGWASVSWSQSERTDEFTNTTTEYYLDTPVIANLVVNYELNDRWDFGLKLSVRSGAKYTPIIGLRDNPDHPGHYLPVYGNLNSETLPAYRRLDLQANYKTTIFGNDAEWNFAILNVTGNRNVSGYYFAPDGNETPDNFIIDAQEGMGSFPAIGLKIHFD